MTTTVVFLLLMQCVIIGGATAVVVEARRDLIREHGKTQGHGIKVRALWATVTSGMTLMILSTVVVVMIAAGDLDHLHAEHPEIYHGAVIFGIVASLQAMVKLATLWAWLMYADISKSIYNGDEAKKGASGAATH